MPGLPVRQFYLPRAASSRALLVYAGCLSKRVLAGLLCQPSGELASLIFSGIVLYRTCLLVGKVLDSGYLILCFSNAL